MADFETIQVEIADHIGVLKFNRPDQLNAMNRQMMDEIIEGIHLINNYDNANVAVIYGAALTFMAGADIKEYGSQSRRVI